MVMCLLPRRAPFSDWCAQLSRILDRAGCPNSAFMATRSPYLRSCYDCGLSPLEVAGDILCEDRKATR